MSTPHTSSRPTSRSSTIHSERTDEGPSFAFETPTPAQRPGSGMTTQGRPALDLAAGEIRAVSESEKRALAPALRSRKNGQSVVGQFDWSPSSPPSTIASPAPPQSSLPVQPSQSQPLAGRQKITIRSDPGLLTCFDVRDKEVYDLWAPRV